MKKLILGAALPAVAAINPAQAHHGKWHHLPVAPSCPGRVGFDDRVYQPETHHVCGEPRQAGLGHGNTLTQIYFAHHRDRHHD